MRQNQANPHTKIGTAWSGKHVVIIQCRIIDNQFIQLKKSLHAPTEPPHQNCAETLSRFLSIGYTLTHTYQVNQSTVEYVLVKG